jgi:hypothetical protein
MGKDSKAENTEDAEDEVKEEPTQLAVREQDESQLSEEEQPEPRRDYEDRSAEYYLNQIFNRFREEEDKLTALGENAKTKITSMLQYTRVKGEAIWDNEAELFKQLDSFKEVTPHTDHFVVYVEAWHKMLNEPEKLAELALESSKSKEAVPDFHKIQVELTGQTGQEKPTEFGGWRWLAERKRLDMAYKLTQARNQPQLTTTQRQPNFIDYAKDIPPELNKLHDWLPRAFLRVNWFKGTTKAEAMRKSMYVILRIYLEKVADMAIGFCGAIIELRKELVGERELAHSQAMIAMKQAEYESLGGMRMPELMRSIREASGPRDVDTND